ncbi:2583_t:CDS:2 [Diversispora eburnea]|uniref:2583_t:CDS:1 n=1 Tax=Diversispora eburnea TaxID=1213867 RepID=A0A9N8Z9A3_9GLOM|nr:2583_t:CDS:2 [Diversispora eburnea]
MNKSQFREDNNDAFPSDFLISESSYISEPSFMEDVCFMEETPMLDNFEVNENNGLSDIEKWETVHIDTWLKKLYKDKPVPLFERNPATANALHKISLLNQQQDAISEIILQQQKIHALEYRTEALRIKDILDTIGISKENLSKNGALALKSLSSLATIFGLKDVERSSYLSAIAQLTIDSYETERQRYEVSRIIESLKINTQEAKLKEEKLIILLTNLRKKWDLHEKQKIKEWEANNDLVSKKAIEYNQKLIRLEKQYSSMNIEKEGLNFRKLKQREEKDIMMAQLKLDEAKQTLKC